jgi:hypothetical protein
MAAPKDHIPATTGSDAPVSTAEDISRFLGKVKAAPPVHREPGRRGRLIFAMDATLSRQPTWDQALQIQGEMFAETEAIGGLDVQLVYFRGFDECRASKWASSPKALADLMAGIECRGGSTQIGRVLSHITREAAKDHVTAGVYVGDSMEENADILCQRAGEIGLLGIPIFMFQEGRDFIAVPAYREIARLTRGAYFRFDSTSAKLLRELLAAVAIYAAGGHRALADHARRGPRTAQLLLEQMN